MTADTPGQFAWDPVLTKFRGGPVKKPPCSLVGGVFVIIGAYPVRSSLVENPLN